MFVSKSRALALAMTIILTAGFSAHASAADMTLDGVDLTPVVEYYKTRVHPIDKPFSIFNWSTGAKDPFWDQERADNDVALLKVVKNWARSFWTNYGMQMGAYNMMGSGLYGAADPLATISYGYVGFGYPNDSWVLLQLKTPKGLRLLDLVEYDDGTGPFAKIAPILRKFGCNGGTNDFFAYGAARVPASCQRLGRKLFQELVPVDLIAYGYQATGFEACKMNVGRAFVVIGTDWITQESIRFFTPKSTLHEEERRLIQTLIMLPYEKSKNNLSPEGYQLLTAFLKAHPQHALKSSKVACEAATCHVTAQFCNSANQCEEADLGNSPRPGGALLSKMDATNARQVFLWPDLEGKPKSSTSTEWLKKNYAGCEGKMPYQEKP